MELVIREEQAGDRTAVRELLREAFGGEDEALLVDALHEAGDVRLSLVAERDGQVVGQILFSAMGIDDGEQSVDALALAPMAVLPAHQRQGVGSVLVQHGLERCAQAGHRIVLVVGHPEYYPRFGFAREHARRLESPYQGNAFLALELVPGALDGINGRVRYAGAFDGL